jgi:uncharacterized alpha-E superfamily protein
VSDAQQKSGIGWEPLLAISGNFNDFVARYSGETDRDVLNFFSFDTQNPDSIISLWTSARENARSIRELISSEMWEAVDVAYIEVNKWDIGRLLSSTPHNFFTFVKNSSYLFQGITDRTLILGEPREWLNMGAYLERACQTSRILDVKYHDLLLGAPARASNGGADEFFADSDSIGGPLDTHRWISVLRSVSGFEMFCKTHRDGITPQNVVSFLVLNELFPGSVRHGIGRVDSCLRSIAGPDWTRNSQDPSPSRLIGRLAADLSYTTSEEIIERGLHMFLEKVLFQCAAIGDAIARNYLL